MRYGDSLSAVSTDGYRLTDHPARIAALRASSATVAGLRCDIVTPPGGERPLRPSCRRGAARRSARLAAGGDQRGEARRAAADGAEALAHRYLHAQEIRLRPFPDFDRPFMN